jgi:azurin
LKSPNDSDNNVLARQQVLAVGGRNNITTNTVDLPEKPKKKPRSHGLLINSLIAAFLGQKSLITHSILSRRSAPEEYPICCRYPGHDAFEWPNPLCVRVRATEFSGE